MDLKTKVECNHCTWDGKLGDTVIIATLAGGYWEECWLAYWRAKTHDYLGYIVKDDVPKCPRCHYIIDLSQIGESNAQSV